MICLFYLLACIIFIEGVLITGSIIKLNDKKLQESYEKLKVKSDKKIKLYILIAVFNESAIIEDTYNYFHKIIYKYDDIRCIFITTEKETAVFGKNKTKEKLEKCISNNNKFSIIHYPEIIGNKPSQLNYCIKMLKEHLYSTNHDCYICQYDADSRPELESFDEIINIIRKTGARVIQQPTKYNSNYGMLGKYMRLEACFQSRWAYGFERRNQFLSCKTLCRKYFMPYAYCVGHGMVVESQLLYDMGMYPIPSEDVPFGLKMMLIGEPIYPTVHNDVGRVTETFRDLLFQSGNWIKAPLLARKMYKEVKKIKKISISRTILYAIKVFGDFLSWIQYFLFMIGLIILTVKSSSFWIIIYGYIFLLFEAGPSIYYTHKYIFKELNIKELVFLILISPVRSIVRGFGIVFFLYQSLFGWYYDKGRKK